MEANTSIRSTASSTSSEAYVETDPDYRARVTVPVLWDKRSGEIVSNESADILRMLETVFAAVRRCIPVDLYPEPLRG